MALRLRAGVPGPAELGLDTLGGRRVVRVEVRSDEARGALSPAASATVAAAADRARASRLPLLVVLTTSGADVRDGVAALHGWGGIARALTRCSGVVPVLAAVTGPVVAGPSLLLGLTDVVVLVEDAVAFVNGPHTVTAVTGERVDATGLGGAAVHARRSGLAADVAGDLGEALGFLAAVLAHLPDHVDAEPPRWRTDDPADRPTPEAGAVIPAASSGSYDVRLVTGAVLDDGELVELWSEWAPNLVTGFGCLGGRPVGVLANQPLALAGTLDIPASQKGARFVDLCDAFGVPVVTFVDTPGFFPGKDLEWRGMIRHGAQLVAAYARATVPRLCLVLRKAYGGAYIVMDSKGLGSDLVLAWPTAEVAVMGARGAVEILHRRAGPEERAALEAAYEARYLTPWIAAERGLVDAVIDPAETRAMLVRSLAALESKRERLPRRTHDTGPL